MVSIVYFLYAAVLVALRPHRIPTDKVLAPLIACTYGVLCALKYTESDSAAFGTILSVLQVTQMMLRMWVMYREQQWQQLEADEEEERNRLRLCLLLEIESKEDPLNPACSPTDAVEVRSEDGSQQTLSVDNSSLTGAAGDVALVVDALFWDSNGDAIQVKATSTSAAEEAMNDESNPSFDGELLLTNREKMALQERQLKRGAIHGGGDGRAAVGRQQPKNNDTKSLLFSMTSYL
jgi:hypothetical protein